MTIHFLVKNKTYEYFLYLHLLSLNLIFFIHFLSLILYIITIQHEQRKVKKETTKKRLRIKSPT